MMIPIDDDERRDDRTMRLVPMRVWRRKQKDRMQFRINWFQLRPAGMPGVYYFKDQGERKKKQANNETQLETTKHSISNQAARKWFSSFRLLYGKTAASDTEEDPSPYLFLCLWASIG